jgi:hypothetical protein
MHLNILKKCGKIKFNVVTEFDRAPDALDPIGWFVDGKRIRRGSDRNAGFRNNGVNF